MTTEIRFGGRGQWGLLARTRLRGPRAGPIGPWPAIPTVTPLAAGNNPMEADSYRMLRILHTADVHLGARHADLGDAASGQRERQFAAFKTTIDLALGEKVDIVLIAGDLFDSNTQPTRSVERVAAELARLVRSRIRTVIIPGTHDVYDRASVYRAHDLKALSGSKPNDEFVTVLSPDKPEVLFAACDALILSSVFDTKRAPHSPLRNVRVGGDPRATWKIGLLHAAVAISGKTDGDEVVVTRDEIASTGLDYLALGHWHSAQQGRAGHVLYAYSGAPEPVALDQDRAGKVLIVALDESRGAKTITFEERTVGKTRFEKVELDAATIRSQPELVTRLMTRADPDLVLDVRLKGIKSDELDLDTDEVETQLRRSFLKVRIRDSSLPALTEGPLPSPDTIAGAFIRDVEAQIAELERGNQDEPAGEMREALRLGRLLMAGHEISL
jgi:DNA repair exonuclease SbcCD nuclease subunit